MIRQLSKNGLEMIKEFEGLRTKAYKVLPSERYYTIGYGHYGSDVTKGQVITEKYAEQLLVKDLETAIRHVNGYMNKYNFNQNEFDALVSFTYNIGNINQLTRFGLRSKTTIANKILEYTKSGGKVLNGLVKRRKKEQELFLTPVETLNYEDIAKEVIAGKWGNGSARRKKLTEAGYDYTIVQQIVNTLLKK